ncbi:MAG: hypothetical protein R3F62_03920 [Planctomycetota bacterium]
MLEAHFTQIEDFASVAQRGGPAVSHGIQPDPTINLILGGLGAAALRGMGALGGAALDEVTGYAVEVGISMLPGSDNPYVLSLMRLGARIRRGGIQAQGNRMVRAVTGRVDDAAQAGPIFGPNDLAYGPSAGGRLRDFANSGGGRVLSDVVPPGFPGGKDAWISLSTETIEEVVSSGGKIHFDLSNVQCLDDILAGVGEFADSVTGHELRYLRDHWERLREGVTFYRGGREAAAPW